MDLPRVFLLELRRLRCRVISSAHKHPRIAACIFATLVLGTVSATVLVSDAGLAFGSRIPLMSGARLIDDPRNGDPTLTAPNSKQREPGVGFTFTPTNIDLSSSSIAFNWWPTGCGQSLGDNGNPLMLDWGDTDSGKELSQLGCGQIPRSFDVWVDSNLSHSWNASDVLMHSDSQSVISFTSRETFDTVHNFTWMAVYETLAFRRQHSMNAWYPFDKYTTSTTLEVFRTPGLGPSSNTSGLHIDFLHLYGGLSGYNLFVERIERVKTSRTDQAIFVQFSIHRCIGVKIFAMTLFLTNYILAAAMVWVAVCAQVGTGRRPLPESALFLPLTNILLLPQLRAAMPGVPDFGIFMDLFGYYVNIVAIVFSAMFMLFKIVSARMQHQGPNIPQSISSGDAFDVDIERKGDSIDDNSTLPSACDTKVAVFSRGAVSVPDGSTIEHLEYAGSEGSRRVAED